MILKYQHNFEDDPQYPLPYVLVYYGKESELMDIGLHCHIYCKDRYQAMDMQQVDRNSWMQSFHFLKKADAMFCKLSHDV